MTTGIATRHPMDVLDAICHRRAVRSYRTDLLGKITIRQFLDAAVHAPTAMHREPWALVVVQDRAVLQRISDRAKALVQAEALIHRDLLRAPGAAGTVLGYPACVYGFGMYAVIAVVSALGLRASKA